MDLRWSELTLTEDSDKVNGGPHIKKRLDLLVERLYSRGKFEVSSHPKPCDVFIIAVPTPITNDKS